MSLIILAVVFVSFIASQTGGKQVFARDGGVPRHSVVAETCFWSTALCFQMQLRFCAFSPPVLSFILYICSGSPCVFMRVEHSTVKLFRSCSKELLADVRHHISLPRNMQAGWMQRKIGTWSYSLCPAFRVYLLKEENVTETVYLANNKANKSTPKSTLQKGASSALKSSRTTNPMKEAVTPQWAVINCAQKDKKLQDN